MTIVYHQALPESYLLVLGPGADPWGPDLARHLRWACRSGKAAVWVDCRLLDTLPVAAARLLWACHLRLRRRHMRLVLCRVSAGLEHTLRQAFSWPALGLCLAPDLDGAAEAAAHAATSEAAGRAGA